MKLKAIIEIPKNNDQRWHLNFPRTAIENFGAIKDVIPVNGGKMPVAYGYLDNIFNNEEDSEDHEKENLDVIVFSNKVFDIGEDVDVVPFGMIIREDGDHKILSADDTVTFDRWEDVPQEEKDLIMNFFGYKSAIKSIDSKIEAEKYITNSLV